MHFESILLYSIVEVDILVYCGVQVRRVLEEKNQIIASMREEIQGMKLSLGLGVSTDLHQVSIDLYRGVIITDRCQVSSDLHKVSTVYRTSTEVELDVFGTKVL